MTSSSSPQTGTTPETPTHGPQRHAGALEPLASGVAAQVTLTALLEASEQGRVARRQALREAVAAHGPSKVSAALGISRQALSKLTRPEGSPRDRVTHRPDSSPTGGQP